MTVIRQSRFDAPSYDGHSGRRTGILVEPSDGPQHYPLIAIICHGHLGSKEWGFIPSMQECLAVSGIPSVAFDQRGCGNDADPALWQFGNYLDETADIGAVLDYLFASDLISFNEYVLIGHSKGADDVILYPYLCLNQNKLRRWPRAIIPIAPRFNLNDGLQNQFGLENLARLKADPTFSVEIKAPFKDRSRTVMGSSVLERLRVSDILTTKALSVMRTHLSKCPSDRSPFTVVFIHAKDDAKIPIDDSHAFVQALTASEDGQKLPVQFIQLPTGGHSFSKGGAREMLIEAVLSVLNEL